MNLFQLGEFVLNSGRKSRLKIECDALTDDDWKTLAYMAWKIVWPFSEVHGVPRGGLKFAEELRPYCSTTRPHPILIADDVFTTGGSMERLRTSIERGRPCDIVGVVVFARGECPSWITPIFQLPKELFDK